MPHTFSCNQCLLKSKCQAPCPAVEQQLPAPERGVLHSLRRKGGFRAARRIRQRMRETRIMLEHRHELIGLQRVVFDLTYNDGLSQREIAQRLGVHRRTVGSTLEAARRKLARHAMQDNRPRRR
jgi:predicted DNA-binding protein (UPF0251 family)